jgi:SAM-dependent methyltransferase
VPSIIACGMTGVGRVGPLADTNVLQWLVTTPLQPDLIGSYRARELHCRGRQLTSSVPPARRVDTHPPRAPGVMPDFYNELAPLYHLIHQDWDASIRRQGEQLSALIQTEWPKSKRVLDVSCGIGTQAIGLAQHDYSVAGSDISANAIERAEHEARARGAQVLFSVCDMRQACEHHGSGFDVVISCDNSLPHLLTDDDLLVALAEMLACLSTGGGCIITVRDYETEERGANIVKPYGVRTEKGKRYLIFQVWDFDGEHYDLAFFFVKEDLASSMVKTHVTRSREITMSCLPKTALIRTMNSITAFQCATWTASSASP